MAYISYTATCERADVGPWRTSYFWALQYNNTSEQTPERSQGRQFGSVRGHWSPILYFVFASRFARLPCLPSFARPFPCPSRLFFFFSSTGPTYTQPLLRTSRGLNAVPPTAGVLPYILLAAFEVLHNGVYSAAPSPAFNVLVTSASSSEQHRRGEELSELHQFHPSHPPRDTHLHHTENDIPIPSTAPTHRRPKHEENLYLTRKINPLPLQSVSQHP